MDITELLRGRKVVQRQGRRVRGGHFWFPVCFLNLIRWLVLLIDWLIEWQLNHQAYHLGSAFSFFLDYELWKKGAREERENSLFGLVDIKGKEGREREREHFNSLCLLLVVLFIGHKHLCPCGSMAYMHGWMHIIYMHHHICNWRVLTCALC